MRVRLSVLFTFAPALTLAAWAALLHDPDRLARSGQAAGFLAAALIGVWAIRGNVLRRHTLESFRQLSGALDHAGEGIARLDTRGNYVGLNAVYARCFGYEPREIIGRHWTLAVDPRDHLKMRKAMDQMLQTGLAEIDALARRKDAGVFHQHVVLAALRDPRGKPLGNHCFMKDITLRKLSEAALADSQRRFRVLATHAPVGIFQSDLQGRCSYVNARLSEMTGIDSRQAENSGWFAALHPDDREPISASWRESAAAGRPWNAQLRFCPPGSAGVTRASCTAAPLRDEAGPVRGYIGTITDITALKESEETLAAQARELHRSNRELEQFAYIASHDLQEPLRTVANFTQLLARRYRGKLGLDADQFIQYAVEGAQRMRSLIDDVLHFARVSRDPPGHEPVDLQSLLAAVLADLAAVIQQKNALISSDPLPTVTGSPSQLHQVLQNLIENAIKFCGRQPRIHIEADRRDGDWVISVRDNGIGIDPDSIGKIFQVFQRLHGNTEFPGNGIGLAVCQRIIERHGGTIEATSHPDEGSTFKFTLPAANPAPAAETFYA
jgi:PAS domain S-box-containing protein